jgi:hypothetical protein
MRSTLIALLFLCASSTLAQEVKINGQCVDNTNNPIEFVHVHCDAARQKRVLSNEKGFFELLVQANTQIEIICKTNNLEVRKIIVVGANPVQRTPDFKFNFSQLTVTVVAEKVDPFDIPKLAPIDYQNQVMNSVEKSLVYTTVASSNNELTSNYNVRGGSYDENLVYVNGFNINRPFLTRSGQQEGMSFINSALVKDVRFSGGGFDAQYGDKLSSVLDITYKTPDSLATSIMASLLGVESHLENRVGTRFDYLIGARYRNNGYLLNALPTKGAYNPVFMDAQFLTNYALTENLRWSVLGHFSSNRYRFAPQTSQTDFGIANEAYRFMIYFDGQENTFFQTFTGGTSLKWKAGNKTKLDFYATIFNSNERENYDIQGQYFINQLETDPSKEEYGDSIAVLGIGTFLNHARNQLHATLLNLYHNGEQSLKRGYTDELQLRYQNHKLLWGINFQKDLFRDQLSEWKMIDSAGYSLPKSSENILLLQETIKNNLQLQTVRATGFVQVNSSWSKKQPYKIVEISKKTKINKTDPFLQKYVDTVLESTNRLTLNYGVRAGYTQINNDYYLTPRIGLNYMPRIYMVEKGKIVRRNVLYRVSSGLYYQPPIYREFRTFSGELNPSVLAQKSFHAVAGTDIYFNMWERESPFKFTAEAFYKYLWDVNAYQIDNVRTRYYANNDAIAYAYGMDLNVHGQFIKGIESFFKVGVLSTKEKFKNEQYYDYYNASGELIKPLVSTDLVAVDSVKIVPGYIPRPTDQLINFGALIQDKMPGYESISVQMGVQFGTPLPYGTPDTKHYNDTLRYKQSYFRVDLGMSYDLLYKQKQNLKKIRKYCSGAILSFEVFNLLGYYNILSKQWIQDVNGTYYSIPNYLTQRRFNLKFIARF